MFRVERKRGPVWYAKYRLPDGRQVQKKIRPAWTGRGRPAAAEWLRYVEHDPRVQAVDADGLPPHDWAVEIPA